MLQLSFVDVSDMARESMGGCRVIQDTEVGDGCFPPVHRLMNVQYSWSRFVSVLRFTGCHLRHWEAFSDFLVLVASELDMARIRTPEGMAHCQKICDRYTTVDIENINEMFSLMVCALEAKFHDFLGAIFMKLKLGDNFRGQHFTPYSVQCLMVRLLTPGVQDTIRREGIVTVSDPASGATGMLIAYAERLLEVDISPSWHMFGSCVDIDPMAADMVFIQLSLLSITVRMVTDSTFAMQFNRVWYTPACYFNDSKKRLPDPGRHRVMLAFMCGSSDIT